MVEIASTGAEIGECLILRFPNGNVAAGVARAVSGDVVGLKVWFDQWEQITLGEDALADDAAGIEKDYLLESGCRVYRASRNELIPLLSPVNDIDDINEYLDGLIALEGVKD